MSTEIERKFIFNGNLEYVLRHSTHREQIIQMYLITTSNKECRIRKTDDKYTMTFKADTISDEIRKEVEIEISRDDYEDLSEIAIHNPIEKLRMSLPAIDDHINEVILDSYRGQLQGLNVVEVEFSDKSNLELPAMDIFGPEVTNDVRFKNNSLSNSNITFITNAIAERYYKEN